MRYIEVSSQLRLRPSHLLLMVYRYVSGIYQTGDLSALNYIKGYADGLSAKPESMRILTVSGHGIGEAEMWFLERMRKSHIETISFRLIDTQLLQFLWTASANDIKVVFAKFHDLVQPYQLLSELVSDPGLIPYWCEQAEAITRSFERGHIRVFSDSPLRIPASSLYDLIYVSDGLRHFDEKIVERLREHLTAKGYLAILAPATVSGRKMEPIDARFADSKPVQEAKAAFRELLEKRGYYLTSQEVAHRDRRHKCIRREAIRFSVLAPANLVLLGELILISLYEHISDRARLEILNEVAARYRDLRTPVNEKLQLYIMEANQ